MARIFKTSSGLPLAIYIEPSCPNRPGLLKSILANGGAPAPRIEKANVILVDAQTRNGRECARNQLDTGSERIVLFVEWIEACVSAGKLLGEDVDWGNLRIQDPEIVDESLYEEPGDSHVPHVKQDIKEEDHADTNGHGRPPRHRLVFPEENCQSHLVLRPGPRPPLHSTPKHTLLFVPHLTMQNPPGNPRPDTFPPVFPHANPPGTLPAPADYGRLPTDPEYSTLFLSSCEEWERIKREGQAYVSPKRKSQVHERHVSPDQPTTKVPGPAPIRSRPGQRRRSPLPAGSTKRGPKRRESQVLPGDFTSLHLNLPSESQPLGMRLENDSDDVFDILPLSHASSSRTPKKAVIKSIRDHGGTTAFKMEDAAYIIVSRSAPQYQELAQEAEAIDRIAVPVAWIRKCIEEQQIVSYEGFAVVSDQRVVDTLTEEDIINAAMADLPPSPVPSSSSVGNKKPGHRFTEHDQEFLQKRLAWTYARDPGSHSEPFSRICMKIHQTTRSTLGWRTIIAQQPMRSAY
ncbi:BRCA1 carboxy-terminus (BRCT) domain protein [Rhizoctonia solani]|uniref:BRCA1 carboxy-terminus (BRCT) domain protein n=1 Tax=Rhizoctonia solani TaxID=456999 RepID=A0A8H8SW87_9AGAM|nr:BRCA1 carboxy-terminus (BRCT) domain protein [Rhizoctonia solani]QRW18943.1 BRCA1 carboxy-terminus (BRCT) domain protein [Rhizoctonia solani]